MVSILGHGNRPPASMLVHVPSTTFSTSRGTHNLKFSYSHNFHTLSCAHKRQQLRHTVHPVICALEGSSIPSRNDNNDNKIMRTMTGASSLVLACAISFFGTSLKMTPKAIACPPSAQEVQQVSSGKSALGSLLEVTINITSRRRSKRRIKYFNVPADPRKEDVQNIKMHAVKLVKNGKSTFAEEFLRKASDQYYEAKLWEAAHNVEMALVEILICQGKYKEALSCRCLSDNQISDLRFPLYMFMIHTMLDNQTEANEFWEDYKDMLDEITTPTYGCCRSTNGT